VARNSLVVRDAVDKMYVFWNGMSHGALDSIRKTMAAERPLCIFFENGMVWQTGDTWNPFIYGEHMADQFDVERITIATLLRLRANKRSKLNHIGKDLAAPIDTARLAYANGRTIAAFNFLVNGVRATAGMTEEDEGCWFVPSQSKPLANHRIDATGWCNCSAVEKGHRECVAMYVVWMYQRLIDPAGLLVNGELSEILEQIKEID